MVKCNLNYSHSDFIQTENVLYMPPEISALLTSFRLFSTTCFLLMPINNCSSRYGLDSTSWPWWFNSGSFVVGA